MARPTPIIVPGQSSMGSREKSSQTTVDLSWIPQALALFNQYVTKPKQEVEGANALASWLTNAGVQVDNDTALSLMRSGQGDTLTQMLKPAIEQQRKDKEIGNVLEGLSKEQVPYGSEYLPNATKPAYTPDIMSKFRTLTKISGALGSDPMTQIGNLLGAGKKIAEPDRYESLGNGIFWDKETRTQVTKPETVTPKADMIEMEIDGKTVTVPASVAVASLDRKAQREQTEAIQGENRALRKQMHEENLAMRDEYRKINYAYKDDAVMTGIVKNFNSDTTVKQTEKMDEFANLIVDVANSDNPIGHASLATLMARASGEVGNLSEADKKPFGGSKALDEKTKQFFKELYDGKKTPENLKFISDLAKTFQATGKRKKAEIAYERSNQYAQSNKKQGKTPQEIFSVLAPFENYDAISKGKEQKSLREKYDY